MRFDLTQQKAKLLNYTPRRELHGSTPQPAASLHFSVRADAADILPMFSPTLRSSLYHKPNGVDLADSGHDMPEPRYPEIEKPIPWKAECVGAELTIHFGIGGKSAITLPDCTIDGFTLAPFGGGIVDVCFKVACHPDQKQSGQLAFMIQEEFEISVAAPEA